VNLVPDALAAAIRAYGDEPIDMAKDTDEEHERCLGVAIKAYLSVLPSGEGELREGLKGARVSSLSFGNPDPAQRSANVTMTFIGPDALSRKNRLENALAALRQQEQG
jgi:hypothetical protein